MSQDDNHREGDTPTPGEPPGPGKPSEEQPATPFDEVADDTTDSASLGPTEETSELPDEREEDPTPEVVDGDFDIFDLVEDGKIDEKDEEPITTPTDYESTVDSSL
ncbi:hypothetical protein, partial [Halorubrum sp. Atlit-26R]|uniref:hypothetical protein n=1 Tax=Halorubrum sp. Atlit-26R TaxID=2282128 RepID=UPI0026E531DD